MYLNLLELCRGKVEIIQKFSLILSFIDRTHPSYLKVDPIVSK